MKNAYIRKLFLYFYIFVWTLAGVFQLVKGHILEGVFFLIVGGLSLFFKIDRIRRREKQAHQDGFVPFDERNVAIAGSSALLTMKIQFGMTGLLILGLYVLGKYNSLMIFLCLYLAVSASILQISYKVLNKKH
jgi:hypothetical protein